MQDFNIVQIIQSFAWPIIQSCAWPAALVIISFILKEQLINLLMTVTKARFGSRFGSFEIVRKPINTGKTVSTISGLHWSSLVYKQLEKGRIEELLEWFEQFSEVDFIDTEIALIRGFVTRICGVPSAFRYLQQFREGHREFYYIAMYELALLKFAKDGEIFEEANVARSLSSMAPGIQKLWKSLLALSRVREGNYTEARKLFNSITMREEDAFEAYASLQLAIVAGALGEDKLMEAYFDLARQINRSRIFPANTYPYVTLMAKHYRAFVNSILGVQHELNKQDIQLLKGVSHLMARYAHILRLNEPAIETLVRISSGWKNRLTEKLIRQRLLDFERYNLQYGGTIIIPRGG